MSPPPPSPSSPPSTSVSIPTFARTQLSLLAAELAAETHATRALLASTSPRVLAHAGLAIPNLTVAAQRTGLGGKTVFELVPDAAIDGGGGRANRGGVVDGARGGRGGHGGGQGAGHGIRVGDVVRVAEQPRGGERKAETRSLEAAGVEGVVVAVGGRGVSVAVGEEALGRGAEGLGGRLWM